MFNYDELEEVIGKIREKVTLANRSGKLDKLLTKWGLDELVNKNSFYDTYKNGKIVVIGASEVKEKDLVGIVKSLGLNKNRFEFCLDYNKSKTYPYKKFRYNPDYRVVIFGPVPHSSIDKNGSSSIITEMKNNVGYPRVEVLSSNEELKITKSNFKNKLQDLKYIEYI